MLLLKIDKKMQKTHRYDYVPTFLEKETDKKNQKSSANYLETYGYRAKTHISKNRPGFRKPTFLLEEQVEEVANVVFDRWLTYIAKYP